MKAHRTSESIFGSTNTSEEARTRHEEELRVRRADAAHRGRIVTRIGLCVIVLAIVVGGVWTLVAKQRADAEQRDRNAAQTSVREWKPEVCGNPDAKMHIKLVAANDMMAPREISYLIDKAVGVKPSTIYAETYYLDRRPSTPGNHEEQEAEKPAQSFEITIDGKKCYEIADFDSLDGDKLYRDVERIYSQCYPNAQYPLVIPAMKVREIKQDVLPTMSIPQLPGAK